MTLKLFYTTRSPYAAKVRAVALERNINLELIEVADLTKKPQALIDANPIGKIPALVLEDGSTLFDSPVICQYLDTLGEREKLIPHKGSERYHVLKIEATADAVMDACVAIFMESLRPEELRFEPIVKRQLDTIHRVLDYFNRDITQVSNSLHLGSIALACALGYINLRFKDLINWEYKYPELLAWYQTICMHPSLTKSIPSSH